MDKKKVIVLFVLLLSLLVAIFIPGYLKMRKLARQNRQLENQIQEIQQVNRRLREQQQKLKSDPVYLEQVAREKLGVVRKGEVVYKVLPPQENQ